MKSKIFILTISCLVLFIVLFSCKKKNTEIDNNPPNTPFAPQISIDTSEIGKKVYFTIFADDPDDDSIAFRFDWSNGDTSGWSNFAPSGETISMYHYFHSKGTFYIRAQAKDNHEGFSDWSEPDSLVIQDSAWTLVWTCVTPSAPWSSREYHTSVVFDNKIWVIGGDTDSIYYNLNDVWFSTDGVNWTCATEAAQWLGRASHTSVVFDNKIWTLGGVHVRFLNDVWYSTDGVNWTCATDSAEWSRRQGHTSVVFDNKMWVLGGWNVSPICNDVWCSPDGINWTRVNEAAQWYRRELHTSVVFDNKIWILGGLTAGYPPYAYNDVWFSKNGADWICATDSAAWSIRGGHTSVVFDDKIWVIGFNDVWFSTNGRDWYCATDSAPWSKYGRFHSSVVFDNKIWILGGYPRDNDIWYAEIVRGRR